MKTPFDEHDEEIRYTESLEDEVTFLMSVVRKIEWSSYQQGQGSGFMGSGGDGWLVSCCPVCHGINPDDPGKIEFVEESHGHRKNCIIKKALNKKRR